jgi:hypothetical protein
LGILFALAWVGAAWIPMPIAGYIAGMTASFWLVLRPWTQARADQQAAEKELLERWRTANPQELADFDRRAHYNQVARQFGMPRAA